jgi:hypothetical protein
MTFSIDMSKFVKKALDNADAVVRKTVLDIGRRLVERTPVGDAKYWKNPDSAPPGYVGGHARANWSHSEGSLRPQEFKTIDGNAGEDNVSFRRIMASCKRGAAAGKVHFIQNSVPYIERLEDGHSQHQAPAGIVSVTSAEFQSIVGEAVRSTK